MRISLPQISRQVYSTDALEILKNNYSAVGPQWSGHQMEWLNNIYISFKDHDKFLIIIYLIKKTLDFYSRNFVKLSYLEFYSKETVEIEKFSISEISKTLQIPKESARRKVIELEAEGVLIIKKKKIIIDRSKFYHSKPEDTIKRVSRFLSLLSVMCVEEKILSKKITSEELELIIKKDFSYIWKIYYELQIPTMITYKSIFDDLESFHIFGTCVVNQHLFVKKLSENNMGRDTFVRIMLAENKMEGINAMSISDITGIPRATVIRKLRKLVKQRNLTIDFKKHYRLSGIFAKKLMPLQKDVLVKLSEFSCKIFNLNLNEKKAEYEVPFYLRNL